MTLMRSSDNPSKNGWRLESQGGDKAWILDELLKVQMTGFAVRSD